MDLKRKHGTLLKNVLLKALSLAEESHVSVACVCNQLMGSAMIGSYCLNVTCPAVYTMEAKFFDFMHHGRKRIFLREREREEMCRAAAETS